MLAVLFVMSVFYPGEAEVNYGKDFITAFPENIAYYYPISSNNSLKITALYNNTHSRVIFNGSTLEVVTLYAGQTKIVYLPTDVEEHQLGVSSLSVQVTSNNDITVFSVSMRGDSIQTNAIPPSTNLDKLYQIPFLNFTSLILTANNYSTSNLTDFSSLSQAYNFQLVVINAEQQDNNVTVMSQPGGSTTISRAQYLLLQNQFLHFQGTDPVVQVSASGNVSVLLTHPCLDTFFCRCNMIVHQIRPSYFRGTTFLMPPPNSEAKYTRLFVTSEKAVEVTRGAPLFGSDTLHLNAGSSDFLPIFPFLENGQQNVSTTQPVSLKLIMPGSVMELLPMSSFSACFLVHKTSTVKSEVLVIVKTAQTSKVNLDWNSFNSLVQWKILNGTEYSFAYVALDPIMSPLVIWHQSSKIAVYVFERMATGTVYGGPAISISDEPDPKGCVVTPALINISNKPMSWPKSRKYCLSLGGSLVSPGLTEYQQQMALKLTQLSASGQAWIGLRRSLLTTKWYWQSNIPFAYTNWDKGQPLDPQKGMCARVSMMPGGNYTWSIARCCSTMRPLCYTSPRVLHVFGMVR